MTRFLMGAAILAGIVAAGTAQAGDKARHFERGSDGRRTEVRRDNDRRDFDRRDFDRHDNDRREFFREHGFKLGDGYFFKGHHHPTWEFRCWSPVYRCYFFWYPELSCYYYWSDVSGCWYPASYIGTVPPTGEFPGMGSVPQTLPAGVAPPPGAGAAGPMATPGAMK